jgi:hypothetical protein
VNGSTSRASIPRHGSAKQSKYCQALGCANPFDGGGSRCPVHAKREGGQQGFKARRDQRLGRLGDAR